MASARSKSLVGRVGAAARKVAAGATGAATGAARAAGLAGDAPEPEEAPATKAPAKKAPAKKAPAKKAPAKKAPAKKATATKAPAGKAPATKAPAKKAPAKKAPATKAPAKKAPATKAPAKKAPAKKAPAKKAPATRTVPAAELAPQLVVLEQESPWTPEELEGVREQLLGDVERLRGELTEVEGDLAGMIENSGEGSGHDQADVGSASFERDQERQIVNNARDMLEQSQHALERIDGGTYGQCETCGRPIGKNRLMAFPRATLCLSCKQREERR
ncbi:TraR/DksA family transcriptional regulator [Nocardioides marmoraquaticus]